MPDHLPFLVFLIFVVAASFLSKKLTLPAAVTGGVLAVLIYFGVGWPGIYQLGTFFLLGTLATSWQKRSKVQMAFVGENDSRRTTGQVLANGGAAAILGLLGILFPGEAYLFRLLMAAAFSSATADTVSSELGNIYGTRFYDILSFGKGLRGADGVISLEGTLFGVAGSLVIAAVHVLTTQFNFDFVFIIIAGTVGNLADSYLGATLERKGTIGNNAVNFWNTVIAVIVAYLLTRV